MAGLWQCYITALRVYQFAFWFFFSLSTVGNNGKPQQIKVCYIIRALGRSLNCDPSIDSPWVISKWHLFNISQWKMNVSVNLQALIGSKVKWVLDKVLIKMLESSIFCYKFTVILNPFTSTIRASAFPVVKWKLTIYVTSQSIKQSWCSALILWMTRFKYTSNNFMFSD